jgi:hypothetical protein
MSDVFINYRTNDGQEVAVTISENLSRRYGEDLVVFRAGKSIGPGRRYPQELLRAARTCQVLIAVIGDNWLARDESGRSRLDDPKDWVRREILAAFESGAHVIPVLVGRRTPRLAARDLPKALAPLAECQYVRYDTQTAEDNLEKLSRSVAAFIPGLVDRTKPEQAAPATPQQPQTSSNDIHNSVQGGITFNGGIGNMARDVTYNQHGGIGSVTGGISNTFIDRASGPLHTGSGSQYNRFSATDPEDEPRRGDA